MIQKMKNLLGKAKKFVTSPRFAMLMIMTVCCTAMMYAQNAAGDYSAGTTALGTVAEEVAKYVPYVTKLCYAIAGVVAIVGAISVYIAMMWRLYQHVFSLFLIAQN